MSTMKQSTSTDSLTGLTGVCDTACHFCTNPSKAEEGQPLIDSKTFLNCTCRFATHIECWHEYLNQDSNPRAKCPVCKSKIVAWKAYQVGVENPKPLPIQWCPTGYFVCGGLAVLAFLILILKVSRVF